MCTLSSFMNAKSSWVKCDLWSGPNYGDFMFECRRGDFLTCRSAKVRVCVNYWRRNTSLSWGNGIKGKFETDVLNFKQALFNMNKRLQVFAEMCFLWNILRLFAMQVIVGGGGAGDVLLVTVLYILRCICMYFAYLLSRKCTKTSNVCRINNPLLVVQFC